MYISQSKRDIAWSSHSLCGFVSLSIYSCLITIRFEFEYKDTSFLAFTVILLHTFFQEIKFPRTEISRKPHCNQTLIRWISRFNANKSIALIMRRATAPQPIKKTVRLSIWAKTLWYLGRILEYLSPNTRVSKTKNRSIQNRTLRLS